MPGRLVSLTSIASEVPGLLSVDDVNVEVSDLTHDSRATGPGVIFVAIDGMTVDGHEFVPAAVASGSPAVVAQRRVVDDIPSILVGDSREAMAHVAAAVHGHPARSMTMVGVTGTNGKTTIGAMCEAALRAAGVSSGIIGTLGARVNGEPIPLRRTTPESSDLQRLLATMRDRSVDTVVMEVSSHALDLHRADAIVLDVAGFTNLSQDHLDFHGDMESYYKAKARLFEPDRAGHAVVNIGDEAGMRLSREISIPQTTVGIDIDADISATIVDQSGHRTAFTLSGDHGTTDISMPLAGSFNVANAAVAFGICLQIGISPDVVGEGLGSLGTIAGRMESIDPTADIVVIVDYAHTPAAVGTVVEAAVAMTEGAIVTVLGAGGDRDQDKRPLMGAAAARHSSVTIVTTDNPRSEDPAGIVDAVAAGAEAQRRARVVRIVDRSEAIQTAISTADAGDVVLILGRGHEPAQEVHGEFIPFSDVDVARAALAARMERTT
jgi:UDP-N-acetylmuramoyl-L-alanyl-D-glutamate--2,6-diaminopimelate ligase